MVFGLLRPKQGRRATRRPPHPPSRSSPAPSAGAGTDRSRPDPPAKASAGAGTASGGPTRPLFRSGTGYAAPSGTAPPSPARRRPTAGAPPPGKGKGKGSGRTARQPTSTRSTRPPRRRRRWLWPLVRLALVGMIWLGIAGLGVLVWFAHDLPDPETSARVTRRPSVTLLAADGRELASFGDIFGASIQAREAPAVLIQAIIATEDRRFFRHFGLDPLGILRAAVINLQSGRVAQGGSTITQQVAKNLFLSPDRTIKRKIQEGLLALWLEHVFTKDQILTLYINRVYLGAGTTGVDAAARRYFDRPATALSLYQAALIAGLPKAPSRLNPITNPEGAHARALEVLDNMVEAGLLSRPQADAAVADAGQGATASLARARRSLGGGHFADWVMEQVDDFVGHPDRDLVVDTTLDPATQAAAEAAVTAVMQADGPAHNARQAALVALDGQGAVRAMVGGLDHARSPFNRAVQARRQAGSAFKPFVYLAGLEAGLTPDSPVLDAPITVQGWSPGNYRDRFRGLVTLREAFALSLNTAAVRVSEQVGRDQVLRVARRLGVGGDIAAHPSIALGVASVSPLDLVAGYVPFVNGGYAGLPHGIRRITDREGRVLYQPQTDGPPRAVIDPATARAMDGLFQAVVVWGTGQAAALDDGSARGKTGTSQDHRDAWFIGYSQTRNPPLVAGVWVGNDDNSPTDGVTGGSLPAQIWQRFMSRLR